MFTVSLIGYLFCQRAELLPRPLALVTLALIIGVVRASLSSGLHPCPPA